MVYMHNCIHLSYQLVEGTDSTWVLCRFDTQTPVPMTILNNYLPRAIILFSEGSCIIIANTRFPLSLQNM